MNYSPSYRARKLSELAARLREIRYDLGTVLGGRGSEHAELRHLDELVLMIDERRGVAKAAERRAVLTPAPAPWSPHKIVPAPAPAPETREAARTPEARS